MMNVSTIAFCLFMAMMATGCLPATSTTFESARMLEPKSLEVQGYGSLYYGPLSKSHIEEWGLRTGNYGLTAAYGISSSLRVRARYEHTHLIDRAELYNAPILPVGSQVNYTEINLKYGWKQRKKNTRAAVALPVGLISHTNGVIWYITPTAYATYSRNDKFEFGLNGKLHFWINDTPSYPWTSIGLGFGFSKDLKRWAIRPEINTDLHNISAGVGFSYVFLNLHK